MLSGILGSLESAGLRCSSLVFFSYTTIQGVKVLSGPSTNGVKYIFWNTHFISSGFAYVNDKYKMDKSILVKFVINEWELGFWTVLSNKEN